jgi:hypothetical protein
MRCDDGFVFGVVLRQSQAERCPVTSRTQCWVNILFSMSHRLKNGAFLGIDGRAQMFCINNRQKLRKHIHEGKRSSICGLHVVFN